MYELGREIRGKVWGVGKVRGVEGKVRGKVAGKVAGKGRGKVVG